MQQYKYGSEVHLLCPQNLGKNMILDIGENRIFNKKIDAL